MLSLSIIITAITTVSLCLSLATCLPSALLNEESLRSDAQWNSKISAPLFAELEELARIVDISYCVGTTGISHPFLCASRCTDFPQFELVDTFNTGPLMSDSCGFMALDHGKGRVIVAFRGTYSIANTVVDLSTVPQEYVPYPSTPDNASDPSSQGERRPNFLDLVPRIWRAPKLGTRARKDKESQPEVKCRNCTVHTGFWTSWQNTRPFILPHLETIRKMHPDYKLHLVGHSLGGAVAALAGLELNALGWKPTVTTFGEPRVGNKGLRDFFDAAFELPSEHARPGWKILGRSERYRRITHVDDPVPLLPLQEWGYRPHAGEVFISKSELQPAVDDVRACYGNEDVNCLAGAEMDESWFNQDDADKAVESYNSEAAVVSPDQVAGDLIMNKRWGIPVPARYKIWQLFFAHRDYFWRLGLCLPGGDPYDWNRDKYHFEDGEGHQDVEGREDL